MRSETTNLDRQASDVSIRKTISSACVVTWFNPQAIIDGTMMLGAFRATLQAAQSIPFISGVATASCLWFIGLTLVISVVRDRFDQRALRGINIACGIVLIFYGGKLFLNFAEGIWGR